MNNPTRLADLSHHELFISIDFYLTRNFVKQGKTPSTGIERSLYVLVVVLQKALDEGLQWFRASSWNNESVRRTIAEASPEHGPALLEAMLSDGEILEPSEFEEHFFDVLLTPFFADAKRRLKENCDALAELEPSLLQIFREDVAKQTRPG